MKATKDGRGPVRIGLTRCVELLDRWFGTKELAVSRAELYSARLPETAEGLKIVHLSDLHARIFGEKQEKLLELIKKEKPDMIFFSGDILDEEYKDAEQEAIRPLLKGLPEISPVFFSMGNHEMRAETAELLLEEMREAGIFVMSEEAIRKPKLPGITVASLLPDTVCRLKNEDESEQSLIGRIRALRESKEEFLLLLSHQPELFESYVAAGVDVTFCGHAHGGLMRLPFGKRLLAPGQGWFPKLTEGVYRENGCAMVVSRGLGGPRIGIAPELVTVTFHREEKE